MSLLSGLLTIMKFHHYFQRDHYFQNFNVQAVMRVPRINESHKSMSQILNFLKFAIDFIIKIYLL